MDNIFANLFRFKQREAPIEVCEINLPIGGEVVALRHCGESLKVDCHIVDQYTVHIEYDSFYHKILSICAQI